ncbi:MAG: hypothetical protein AB7V02_06060, partial [Parvularculaceae bacterium]
PGPQPLGKKPTKKAITEFERAYQESCERLVVAERRIAAAIVQEATKGAQVIVLYKDEKTLQISGSKLRYVPPSRLCTGIFDATDHRLEGLRNWHGAEIFVRIEPDIESSAGGPRDKDARRRETEATEYIRSIGEKASDARSKGEIEVDVRERFRLSGDAFKRAWNKGAHPSRRRQGAPKKSKG